MLAEGLRFGHWLRFARFLSVRAPDVVLVRPSRLFFRRESAMEGSYALIATMSGWTPMMFMTRVRL
jgi:hypothetical protein